MQAPIIIFNVIPEVVEAVGIAIPDHFQFSDAI